MLFKSPSTLPPLAFSTPVPSPNLLRLRRRKRVANEPPPLLNCKRTAPPSCSSTPDLHASYLPTFTNLPFLDCENFGNEMQRSEKAASSLPLLSVTLHPRTKRSRINCLVSSPPQEKDNQDRSEYDSETRRGSNTPAIEENNDDDVTINEADADFSNPLRRASSSKSMLTRRPSVTLTRSLSLQVSLINLAAAGDCCPLSASTTSSMMPKRKSLLTLKTSSSSLSEMQNQDVNHRRSPVVATLDYLATAIRFPDVGIGLSI